MKMIIYHYKGLMLQKNLPLRKFNQSAMNSMSKTMKKKFITTATGFKSKSTVLNQLKW